MTRESDNDAAYETALVRNARNGDLRAFERLVIIHQAGLRAFVALRIQARAETEDLAQETFVIAWRKIADFEPGGSFGSWLRTIAHHLIRNHRRKFRAEGVGGYQELELLSRNEERCRPGDPSDRLAALRDCLAQMDGPSLRLLTERYLEGTSVQELADRSGKGYSALTTQLYRLREILAGCVREQMDQEARQS